MKIKKLSGSFVAATAFIVLSAPAMAGDCTEVIEAIKTASTNLICQPDGNFEGPAIWQWKGKGELGCAVHAKLAKQLFVAFDENRPPPRKKGNNTGHGAANALISGKYETALLNLQTFWDTIEYDANLNSDNPDAAAQAEAQQELAEGFMSMIDPVQGCMP